jgi:hypothetical protein
MARSSLQTALRLPTEVADFFFAIPVRGAGAGCRVGLLAERAGSARPSRAGNGGESG